MSLKKLLLSVATVAFIAGCGGGSSGSGNGHGGGGNAIDVYDYPKYELTQENRDDIAYMGNEERLAYDVYMYLYNYHNNNNGTEIKQLYNISSESETTHVSTVRDLVNKYDLSTDDLTILTTEPVSTKDTPQESLPSGQYDIGSIQELYDMLADKGVNSQQDALEVGCMVEVTDINDLNPKIDRAIESGAKDLEDAFKFLRDGSYNHYWAFDKGLKNLGIDDGCCSLGDEWCHPEYPNKKD